MIQTRTMKMTKMKILRMMNPAKMTETMRTPRMTAKNL